MCRAPLLPLIALWACLIAWSPAHAAFTVRDAIGLRRTTEFPAGDSSSLFSTTGDYFYLLTEQGDATTGARTSTLRMYSTREVLSMPADKGSTPAPVTEVTYAFAGAEPTIRQVRWLSSNTLSFLAETGSGLQLMTLKARRGEAARSLGAALGALSYGISDKGDLAFAVASENLVLQRLHTDTSSIVDAESLQELNGVADAMSEYDDWFSYRLVSGGHTRTIHTIPHRFPRRHLKTQLSPSGRYVALLTLRSRAGADHDCQSPFQTLRSRGDDEADARFALEVQVHDVSQQNSKLVWRGNAASTAGAATDIIWVDDTRLLLTRMERTRGEAAATCSGGAAAYEVSLPPATQTEIASIPTLADAEYYGPFVWDEARARAVAVRWSTRRPNGYLGRVEFVLEGKGWIGRRLTESQPCREYRGHCLAIVQCAALSQPPAVVLEDRRSRRRLLLDALNPSWSYDGIGSAETFRWSDASGRTWQGGLFLPPNFDPRHRYPLVIQTHGFDAEEFQIDGPFGWTTAFAARALTSSGIVVLQVPDRADATSIANEARAYMLGYEGAIEALAERGIIDEARLGAIGFSRTVYHVAYAAAFSRFKFTAITLADGADWGLVTYNLGWAFHRRGFEATIGGVPFGDGLPKWIQNSPAFNLDRVDSAVRLEAIGAPHFLTQWWVGLRVLGKPVEMIYLPNGTHILSRPADRLVSQGGNVDWFRFWLQGHEDLQPNKIEQYTRWRAMRAKQCAPPNNDAPWYCDK